MTPQENTVSAPPNTAQVDIVLPQAHAYTDVQLLGVGRYRYDLRVIRPTFTNVWYPVTGYLRTTPHITR